MQSIFGLLHPFTQIYDLISDVIYLPLGKQSSVGLTIINFKFAEIIF